MRNPVVQSMLDLNLLSPSEAMELDRLTQLDRQQYLEQIPHALAMKALLAMAALESLCQDRPPPGTTLH